MATTATTDTTPTTPVSPERRLPEAGEERAGPRPSARAASRGQSQAKAVVVHSGARDNYQVARALDEAGKLDSLITDLYWPADRPWAKFVLRGAPAGLGAQLLQRFAPTLDSARVRSLTLRGLLTLMLDKLPRAPFAWRRGLMRHTDAALGTAAGRRARRTSATLVSYSYYGYHAFRAAQSPGILFQLHPHPASMRRILEAELAAHPDCAESLQKEWELALPEEDFERLVAEPAMAAHTFVASSFTRQTLVEHGTPFEAITVIPYGVDCIRFSPAAEPPKSDGPLRLLFVGRINQRKGIKYLLEALRLVDSPDVRLTVCGRVVDSLELFRPFGSRVEIRPDVSAEELVSAYRAADLFVFPSVAEGFGQVLLEALACGLPILSTTHTAAPDLIDHGVEGFIVPPCRADLLAERIEWARTHRDELSRMRMAARARAEQCTWESFRAGVRDAFDGFLATTAPAAHAIVAGVRHV